jgi:hypothetical protein
MDGVRSSTTIEIAFQAKPGSSELSCCSVNGPRMMGLLAEYAVMALESSRGFAINAYAPGRVTVPANGGGAGTVTFVQDTQYPLGDGTVNLTVSPSAAAGSPTFVLWLRIPAWSARTSVSVMGQAIPASQIVPGRYLAIRRQWSAGDKVLLQFDFRLRCWEQVPLTCAVDIPQNVLCQQVGKLPPKPVWSSAADAKWGVNGVIMSGTPGATPMLHAGSANPPIDAAPSTMMGWLAPDFSGDNADGGQMVPMSFGARMGRGKGSDDCRALTITAHAGQATYFVRGGKGDMTDIIPVAALPAWSHALRDGKWHHVAMTDDGSQFHLWLDGKVIANGKHTIPLKTAGGWTVGGWADENRPYSGDIAGVRFYAEALNSADLLAAMAATKPNKSPSPKQYVLCSLYRGPILLGFDPCFNPTVDQMPILDATKLACTEENFKSWLPPQICLKFTAIDGKTTVQLADYASLGLRGHNYNTWLALKLPANRPSAPFTKMNPTRTFFVDELAPAPSNDDAGDEDDWIMVEAAEDALSSQSVF